MEQEKDGFGLVFAKVVVVLVAVSLGGYFVVGSHQAANPRAASKENPNRVAPETGDYPKDLVGEIEKVEKAFTEDKRDGVYLYSSKSAVILDRKSKKYFEDVKKEKSEPPQDSYIRSSKSARISRPRKPSKKQEVQRDH